MNSRFACVVKLNLFFPTNRYSVLQGVVNNYLTHKIRGHSLQSVKTALGGKISTIQHTQWDTDQCHLQSAYPASFAAPMSESTTTVPSESALDGQSIHRITSVNDAGSLTRPTGLLVCRYRPLRNSRCPPPFRRGCRKQDQHDVYPIVVHNL
jgi:hypothetical protein